MSTDVTTPPSTDVVNTVITVIVLFSFILCIVGMAWALLLPQYDLGWSRYPKTTAVAPYVYTPGGPTAEVRGWNGAPPPLVYVPQSRGACVRQQSQEAPW